MTTTATDQEIALEVKDDRGRWLAVMPSAAESASDMRLLQSAYLSNLRGGSGWGKDITPAQCYALAVAARNTGLNPLMGELMMLGGNIYVSEAGVLANAVRGENKAIYQGYELEPMVEEEKQAWGIEPTEVAFKCTVYRSDRTRPTIGVGHASTRNIKAREISDYWVSEMAQKRAIERAHSRAFPLPFTGVDEPRDTLTDLSKAAPGVQTFDGETGVDLDERDSTIADLKMKLKWSTARVDLEYRNCGGHADPEAKNKLIERMEAAFKNPNVRRNQKPPADPAAPLVAHDEAEKAIVQPPEVPQPVGQTITKATLAHLFGCLGKLGIKEKPDRLRWAQRWGVTVTSFSQLDERIGAWLCERAEGEGPDGAPHDIAEQPGTVTQLPVKYANGSSEICPACEANPGETHADGCPEIPGAK